MKGNRPSVKIGPVVAFAMLLLAVIIPYVAGFYLLGRVSSSGAMWITGREVTTGYTEFAG